MPALNDWQSLLSSLSPQMQQAYAGFNPGANWNTLSGTQTGAATTGATPAAGSSSPYTVTGWDPTHNFLTGTGPNGQQGYFNSNVGMGSPTGKDTGTATAWDGTGSPVDRSQIDFSNFLGANPSYSQAFGAGGYDMAAPYSGDSGGNAFGTPTHVDPSYAFSTTPFATHQYNTTDPGFNWANPIQSMPGLGVILAGLGAGAAAGSLGAGAGAAAGEAGAGLGAGAGALPFGESGVLAGEGAIGAGAGAASGAAGGAGTLPFGESGVLAGEAGTGAAGAAGLGGAGGSGLTDAQMQALIQEAQQNIATGAVGGGVGNAAGGSASFLNQIQSFLSGGGTGSGINTPPGTGSALQRILSGNGSASDYASVLGQAAPGLISAFGNYSMANKQNALAQQYLGMGAPYRDQLANITNNPASFYNSANAQELATQLGRRYSVGGNPAGSPFAQAQIMGGLNSAYGAERDRLAGYGGLSNFNAAAPGAQGGALTTQAQAISNIGSAVANVVNPQQISSLETLLASLKKITNLSTGLA